MKIELKNVKFFPSGSQETNCFTADIFVEGLKVGYAENSGHGGPTNVGVNSVTNRKLWEEAEAYCKALPAVPYDFGEKFKGEREQDMETVVDDLFTQWLTVKENAKFFKKLDKIAVNSIVVYNPKQLTWYKTWGTWKSYTIAQLLTMGSGIPQVKKTVAATLEKLEPGEEIYNPDLQGIIKEIKTPK